MGGTTERDSNLSPEHERQLRGASAISPELVTARGYRTITAREDLEALGFADYQAQVPGLLVPMWGPDGAVGGHQYKPDRARTTKDGTTVKYESVPGRPHIIDAHPSLGARLRATTEPLWITEGVKKGDAAVSAGLVCVALAGVDAWRRLPGWDELILAGRDVYIAYDSDVTTKPEVQRALRDLTAFLLRSGARPWVVTLASKEDVLVGGTVKQGLDDWFAGGGDVAGLLVLATRPRPAVRTGQNISDPDVLRDAVGALTAANSPPTLFQRELSLVESRVGRDGRNYGVLPVDKERLIFLMSESADWYKVTQVKNMDGEDGVGQKPVTVPRHIRDNLLVANDLWTFPVLDHIVTSPVFGPDGDLRTEPGYDAASRTLYVPPAGLKVPPVADVPTAHDLEKALAALDELFVDFPFADQAARAHGYAMLLQPFARFMIRGSTPLYVVKAPKQGTGKTIFVRSALTPSMGEPPSIPSPHGDEEMEKRLTALFMQASPVVFIDNVDRLINWDSLAGALTKDRWAGRVLGASKMMDAEIKALFVLTANNPRLGADFPRRSVPILLDSKEDSPHRRAFKHSLPAYAEQNRGQLIWAACTLIRSWVAAGRPAPPATSPSLAGYGAWRRVLGGVLAHVGIEGLLSHDMDDAESKSDDQDSFETLVKLCRKWFPDAEWQAKDLIAHLAMTDHELDYGQRSAHSTEQAAAMGKFLRSHKGQRFRGYVLRYRKSNSKNLWKFHKDPADAP